MSALKVDVDQTGPMRGHVGDTTPNSANTPRPVERKPRGLFAQLSVDQQRQALAYTGPIESGDDETSGIGRE